jgi:hypothetical protein
VRRALAVLIVVAGSALALAHEAAAQDDAAAAQSDPPDGIARLRYTDGSVSLQPAGLTDWTAVPVNQPLTVGDALWSDADSHAEVDLGAATARLAQNSQLSLLDLSAAAAQLQVEAGSAELVVRELAPGATFEVDAPNAAVALLQAGEYRFSVDASGTSTVSVRNGRAQVAFGTGPGMNLVTGQRAIFGPNESYAILQAAAPDEFDLWCQQREADWSDAAALAQYVSSDAVGYQDLKDYGEWQAEPDYGEVWFPSGVAADWAPYSQGHWVWVSPWGWSWVDDAPWGFAPFHYGRWAYVGRRWAWVPAPAGRHALYAPALVAWVGGPGTGAALALGGGAAVGWLPLAPGEVYVPGYSASARYVQQVNISNSRALSASTIASVSRSPELQNRYANRAAPHSLTLVAQTAFTSGESVGRLRLGVVGALASAPPTARVPGIVPERQSVLGPISLNRVARPPATLLNRPVARRHEPPAHAPAFELQRIAIAANGGMPLNPVQLAHVRGAPPAPAPGPAAVTGSFEYRGIPERAPHLQAPALSQNPNVFEQRDQELQQEREEQARAQQAQRLQQSQQLHLQLQQQRAALSEPPAQRAAQLPPAQLPHAQPPPPTPHSTKLPPHPVDAAEPAQRGQRSP